VQNNQFTKTDGGRLWGGVETTKFSAMLTAEEADSFGRAARIMGFSKSHLLKQMIAFADKRTKAILARYPDIAIHLHPNLGDEASAFEKLLWDLDNPQFLKWQKAAEQSKKNVR
jgi:hypothetical protein